MMRYPSGARCRPLRPFILILLVLLLHSALLVCSLNNGVGETPAMGFNTWNHFGCNIDEDMVKDMAQVIVDKGLRELGYTYVNLDDCWMQRKRDGQGRLVEDKTRFPSGIKALADHLHSMGLRFGIYSSAGLKTCEKYPASLHHEGADADTWASWGVDYLKYDNCFADGTELKERYRRMGQALNATGRPILYSICEWGLENPAAWAQDVGNSWRISYDIRDDWEYVMNITEINARRWRHARPGAFNDPDMLEVGNGRLSLQEYKTHMSLWSIMKAPLLIGSDLRVLKEEMMALLTNEEVIAINQDALGIQGRRIWSSSSSSSSENEGQEQRQELKQAILVPAPLSSAQPTKIQEEEWTLSWKLTSSGTIRSSADTCLAVHTPFSSTKINDLSQVVISPCDDETLQQRWELHSHSSGKKRLRPRTAPGLCLGVTHSDENLMDLGIVLQLFQCRARQFTTAAFIGSALAVSLLFVAGGVILHLHRTALAIGALTGSILSFSLIELIIFLVLRWQIKKVISDADESMDRNVATLALYLTVIYGILALIFLIYRDLLRRLLLPQQPLSADPVSSSDQRTLVIRTTTASTDGDQKQHAFCSRQDIGGIALIVTWYLTILLSVLCLLRVGIAHLNLQKRSTSHMEWEFNTSVVGGSSTRQLTNAYQGQVLAADTDAPPGLREVWSGILSDDSLAVLLLNRGDKPGLLSASWAMLGLENGGDGGAPYIVRDVWARALVSPTETGIGPVLVPSHGAMLYRVSPAAAAAAAAPPPPPTASP